MSYFKTLFLKNTAGSTINPATDEKLDSLIAKIDLLLDDKLYDSGNSTTAALGAGGSFVGDFLDTTGYSGAIITVVTDQDSATDGLVIESGIDGSTAVHSHTFSPKTNTPNGHHYPSTLDNKYLRVTYANGAIAQGVFKLYTTLFRNPSEEGHVHPLEYSVDGDHPAPITRSVMVAKNPAGSYGNISRTTGGNLKIALEELESSVLEAINRYPVGTGANGSVTLTNADTAYAIPASAPTGSYRITMSNNSDTSIFIGYQNSNSNGIELLPRARLLDDLGSGQQLYAYCASAGKTLVYTAKMVS
jgi:hypothetical protein